MLGRMKVITFPLPPPSYRGIFETQEEARQEGKTERVISLNSAILWGPGNTTLETFGKKASHVDERVVLHIQSQDPAQLCHHKAVTGQEILCLEQQERLKLCLSHVEGPP